MPGGLRGGPFVAVQAPRRPSVLFGGTTAGCLGQRERRGGACKSPPTEDATCDGDGDGPLVMDGLMAGFDPQRLIGRLASSWSAAWRGLRRRVATAAAPAPPAGQHQQRPP